MIKVKLIRYPIEVNPRCFNDPSRTLKIGTEYEVQSVLDGGVEMYIELVGIPGRYNYLWFDQVTPKFDVGGINGRGLIYGSYK